MILFTLFCLTIISLNVDPLAADPEPSRSRYYPWPPTAVIEQPNFPPSISGRTPYRPYFYDSSAREMDEEYYNDQSSMTMTKMSRMLELALISLKEEVKDLKDKLLVETERNHLLQNRVSQLEQSLNNNKMKAEEDDHYITEYAQLNGALSSALGIGRPWVRTFFSFRKTSSFSALSTPITYEITDANVGETVSAGVFTAPRAGYYFFSFDGVNDGGLYPVNVVLVKNGSVQRTSYGSASTLSRLALQDAWVLSAGDTISIQLAPVFGHNSSTTGSLYEDGTSYYTRFLGYSIVLL